MADEVGYGVIVGGMLYDLMHQDVRTGVHTYDPESERMYRQLLSESSPRGQAARISALLADRRPYYGRIQVESGDPVAKEWKSRGMDNAAAYFPSTHYIGLNYPNPRYGEFGFDPLNIMGHEFGHAIGTVLGGGLERHGQLPEYFERPSFSYPIAGQTPEQTKNTAKQLSELLQELVKKGR